MVNAEINGKIVDEDPEREAFCEIQERDPNELPAKRH